MSSHPDDRPTTGREPTQPIGMGTAQGDAPLAGPHDDPAGWGNAPGAVREPGMSAPRTEPYVDVGDRSYQGDQHRSHRGDSAGHQSPVDSAVENLAEPDNRAKLLMAIAFMTALTLLLTLFILLDHLLEDDGAEPVLVEGVPCLVEEGPSGEEAILYCQR